MKRTLSAIAFSLLALGALWAEERFRLQMKVDLNGDGRKETVRLVPYKVGETELGQLIVEDSRGVTLWRAPKCKDAYSSEPFHFLGEFDRGDLECLLDFDGDGRPEIVATGQKSDVRPTTFLVYRWTGKAFMLVNEGMLVPDGAVYKFKVFDPMANAWVDRIHNKGNGRFQLDVSRLGANPGNSKVVAGWNPASASFSPVK